MLAFLLTYLDDDENREKFTQLYVEHKDYLYTVAMSILHHPQDAEDALHEAFVLLAKYFNKISDKSPEEAKLYLTKMVINEARKLYNKRARRTEMEGAQKTENITEDIELDIIEKDYVVQEDYRAVFCFLSKMDSKYRDVLTLSLCYGMKISEIADILHLPPATVKTQLRRGKNMLIEFLGGRS